jgi:hypothetical protein
MESKIGEANTYPPAGGSFSVDAIDNGLMGISSFIGLIYRFKGALRLLFLNASSLLFNFVTISGYLP